MLNKEDNELIMRVGPGTPMGELFRRYWLPALLSSEVPEPDCPPVKLRLLGEDLVAFRTTSGQPAVLSTWCPHRNANLFWGRNEEEGLRCVYHGWKFDAQGSCVDMPNEPPSSTFKDKIHVPAYQAVEAGGFVWVYMGPQDSVPELPNLDWLNVPASQRYVHKRLQECNWLQNLEGEVDSSHVSFLHSNLGENGMGAVGNNWDRHPVFSVVETEWGLAICARRDAPNDEYYWRITPFMLPCYTIVPTHLGTSYLFTAAVPRDDTTMYGMTVFWNPTADVKPMPIMDVDPVSFRATQNKDNNYLIDRELQKTSSFTGIRGVRVQDMAVQEDQKGPMSDRTTEHLGSSDAGVISARRILLRQAKALQDGILPDQAATPDVYRIRSLAINAPKAVPWQELMEEHMVRAPRGLVAAK